jgi:hypothetical protein
MKRNRPAEHLRGSARRDFIKYTVGLGALFGLDRWKVFECVENVGGTAMAAEISCAITNRSVHIVAGAAGFAWFQLLWPHNDVAAGALNNPSLAFHDPKNARVLAGTDQPLTLGPQAPWQGFSPKRQISCFMAGRNEFTGAHIDNPTNSSTIDTNKGLFAACATLQLANPTLVPVISVNTKNAAMPYGAFGGAPSVVSVASGDQIVTQFDSAASSAMGPLASAKNAAYFEAYYKGFLGISAAANRPTYAKGFHTGKIASNLVGINLSNNLVPTPDDEARYGINLSTPTKLTSFAHTLIITAKAFKLGLTSCVMMPAFNDDPHAAFADMPTLVSTVTTLGKILDSFLGDLGVDDPTCAGAKISDNVVISIHTDTPKTPLVAAAWPDDTPGNQNWVYVLGAGWLKNGWYGGIDRSGNITGFDPATGNVGANLPQSQANAMPVAGAIAYAVAKGDMRRVEDFYHGSDISGIVRPKLM